MKAQNSEEEQIKTTLQSGRIHEEWQRDYFTRENTEFLKMAIDYAIQQMSAQHNAVLLDAGCGSCHHAIHLAQSGFRVTGIDFSTEALRIGQMNIENAGISNRITLKTEDLTALSFENESFDSVFCWGVLMHIPDPAKALSELARVLKPGGKLVIAEGNMHSIPSFIQCIFHILKPPNGLKTLQKPEGREHFVPTPEGMLMTRQANIPWIIGELKTRGIFLESRHAGQFSEWFNSFRSPVLKRFFFWLNRFWFRNIHLPGPAIGNICLFVKQ